MPRSNVGPCGEPREASDAPQVFTHEAMATTYTLSLVEADAAYARQAAGAAFEELDLLERRLSRFIESSDISRVNRLAAGRSTVVALETYECLEIALEMNRRTSGAFDVTYASAGRGPNERLVLDAADRTVLAACEGVVVDLGGIGKGFALDRMAALLREWDISTALLWSSTSTVLAFGPRSWPVEFGAADDRRRVELREGAFSGSGTAVRGLHIIDPRTGRPARRRTRAWATAPTAAMADALSTALIVMSEEEVDRYCRQQGVVSDETP